MIILRKEKNKKIKQKEDNKNIKYNEQELKGHNKILTDLEMDKSYYEKSYYISGPIKIIISLFILILLILWLIPYYAIKDNPSPEYIPEIKEIYQQIDFNKYNNTLPLINSFEEYALYVDSRNKIVKNVADKISSLACDYSENYIICQSKTIFNFVRDKFNYVQDPNSFEYVKSPIESLNNLGGDCDDASVLLASLLGSIGIRTRLVFVPNHVYVEAYLPEASFRYKAYKKQDWVALDSTCKNCKFGEVPIKYLDKNLKKQKLKKIYVNVS